MRHSKHTFVRSGNSMHKLASQVMRRITQQITRIEERTKGLVTGPQSSTNSPRSLPAAWLPPSASVLKKLDGTLTLAQWLTLCGDLHDTISFLPPPNNTVAGTPFAPYRLRSSNLMIATRVTKDSF